MTVTANDTVERYDVNGTGPYAFSFRIFSESDLTVSVIEDATGDAVQLTLDTQYSVAGVDDEEGGTVTLTSATATQYASGYTLDIRSNVPRTQPTSITNQGPFSSLAIETALDRLNRQIQDLYRLNSLSLKVPDTENFPTTTFPSIADREGTFWTFDGSGNLETATPIDEPLTASLIQSTLSGTPTTLSIYPRTAAEIAALVTPTDYAYAPGDVRRYGFNGDNGVTTNNTAFQNAITANAGFVPVRVPNMGGYAKLTSRITAPANTTIILEDGAELRWTATAATGTALLGAATRPGIEVQGNNFRIEGRGILKGPSVATYVDNECGIFGKGTSSASRSEGFYIGPGIELTQWGSYGVVLQFWNWINVSGLRSYGNGGYGACFFSCNHGRALGVLVGDIGPGPSSEPIGFCLTHDSTDYDVDAEVLAGRQRTATNPFCQDWEVSGTAYDVPLWHGFNAHGCFDTNWHDIKTYNCKYGAQIAGSSGDAIGYAGENNFLDRIFCTTKRRDGSATTISVLDGTGILLNGGETVRHRNVHLSNFVVEGYGDTTGAGNSVLAIQVTGSITNGSIRNWKGKGIRNYYSDLQIDTITFGAVADATNSVCVHNDFGAGLPASNVDVKNVRILLEGGTAPAEGLRIHASNTNRVVLAGNDFSAATTPYAGVDGTLTKGLSDFVPQITVTGTPTSVSLAAAAGAPRVRLYFNVSGNSTVADFTNFTVGQVAECYFPIAAATAVTTIDRTNGFLAGGANFVSTQYDTLVLEFVNTTGVKFVERSRSANS